MLLRSRRNIYFQLAAGRRTGCSPWSAARVLTCSSPFSSHYGDIKYTPEAGDVAATNMTDFSRLCGFRAGPGRDLSNYAALHKWSIEQPGNFWQAVADFTGVKWLRKGNVINDAVYCPPHGGKMRGSKWFQGYELNFAHNLLPPPNDKVVLVCLSEGGESAGRPSQTLTGKQLWSQVSRCAKALKRAGVSRGDVVAGVMTNSVEAIVCMLGATSLGAAWSSCSPDFGVAGVVDRLGQVKPKVLFFATSYVYNGKRIDTSPHLPLIMDKLGGGTVPVTVPYWPGDGHDHAPATSCERDISTFEAFLNTAGASDGHPGDIKFEPTPFNHPVYIMFSSGTNGPPKCMVHGAGGTLLQTKKELVLHSDMRADDRLLFFTTTGWMMWQWSVSALSIPGARLITYEGSPSFPDLRALWHAVESQQVTHFGASPKFFGACRSAQVSPREEGLNLGSMRSILSTGSPLLPEHYDFIYKSVKEDVHLASISGGTDILGCFMLGQPNLPVRSGEIQALGLGMDVAAVDEKGQDLESGKTGELVCRTPFPSMPVHFLDDPHGEKYAAAYFESEINLNSKVEMWCHGDFIERTSSGGVITHGRSDATLNPGGVRIGTAEIYRALEVIPTIKDYVAAGFRLKDDVAVALFIVLDDPSVDTCPPKLLSDIKNGIRNSLTPRHVPSHVVVVKAVPYTRSGKRMELSVNRAINGDTLRNVSSMVNPECIQEYVEIGQGLRAAGN